MTFSYLSWYNVSQNVILQALLPMLAVIMLLPMIYNLVIYWSTLSGCLERNMGNKEDTEDIGDLGTRPIVSQRLFPRVASQPGAGTGDN